MPRRITGRRLVQGRTRTTVRRLGKPPKIDAVGQSIPVLSVSPAQRDHTALQRLLPGPQWSVYRTSNITSALTLLQQLRPIPLVVCEQDLFPDRWQDLLVQTALLPDPPFVIVTSRLADDYLWAEALNLGAHDVLAKPFDLTELTRTLSLAWLRGQRQREIANTLPIVTKAAVP
jgi:CheY-like chemotaxis protein